MIELRWLYQPEKDGERKMSLQFRQIVQYDPFGRMKTTTEWVTVPVVVEDHANMPADIDLE